MLVKIMAADATRFPPLLMFGLPAAAVRLFAPACEDASTGPISPDDAIEREVLDLYNQHAGTVFRFAMAAAEDRELAQDAVQEAFLRYFVRRKEGFYTTNPKVWVFREARNHVLSARQAVECGEQDEGRSLIDAAMRRQPPGHAVLTPSHAAESLKHILTPRELDIVRLRAEGMSYQEIGEVLGITTGTVGGLLNRAVRKLRGRVVRPAKVGEGL